MSQEAHESLRKVLCRSGACVPGVSEVSSVAEREWECVFKPVAVGRRVPEGACFFCVKSRQESIIFAKRHRLMDKRMVI